MINVKQFIDKSLDLDTKAFQMAIDNASQNGGETVFVPFGTYKLSTIILRDNTNLLFEDGVTIISASSLKDFNADEKIEYPLYQDLSHSKYTCSMFFADNVENISVKGQFKIDMCSLWDESDSRSEYGDGYFRGAKVFALRNVKGIRLSDFKIYNATDISILMGGCKDVIIDKVYINSHIDGISPDCCEDVIISNCILETGDDALVFKTSFFDNKKRCCQRITVSNCIISSRANAIKFGTESCGDFKYININNCSLFNVQHSGIAIESADGSNIFGINISNISMNNVANPLFIYLSDRLRGPDGVKIGSISDINISNVFADVNAEVFKTIDSWYPYIKEGSDYGINSSYPSIIMSTSPEQKIRNISLNNFNVKVLGGEQKIEKIFPKSNDYPECCKFKLPCYGLFIKNAEDTKLYNVNFSAINDDVRQVIVEEN